MIKAVIIDDERQSRKLLRKMLIDFCEGVEVIGEAEDVKTGTALLRACDPQLVFLDIEMPDGYGFDILNAFNFARFNVIFVTGYDQFAIRAIKYAALDYLLKPVDLEELQLAMERLKRATGQGRERIQFLHQHYASRHTPLRKIVLPGRENHVVVLLDDIIRIEAEGSYVMLHLEGQHTHLVVNTLTHYENLLPSHRFFRIHKSHLINLAKVEKYIGGRSSKVQLSDGSTLAIAARRKAAFNQLFKQLGNDANTELKIPKN